MPSPPIKKITVAQIPRGSAVASISSTPIRGSNGWPGTLTTTTYVGGSKSTSTTWKTK
jgi:hypothetical protein